MARKKVVLIDGYSLLFRAFYGTRYLSTSDGRPTNALFGFVSMLFLLLEREKPYSILVAFDAPGKTFRHAEYAEYKAKRVEAPDDLKEQLSQFRDLVNAFGIPGVEVVGYEADDVIGTLAKKAEKEGYEVLIVSGDLDGLQLIDSHIRVMTPRTGMSDVVIYDKEAVKKRYGIEPSQMTDYKALVGDPSDNIPGVRGIGEKAASYLLQKYRNIETLTKKIDEIEPKYRAKLEPELPYLQEYKRLSTLVCDLEIPVQFTPYKVTQKQLFEIQKILQSLEFRLHLKRLPQVLAPYLVDGKPSQLALEVGAYEAPKAVLAKDYETLRKWIGEKDYAIWEENERGYVCIGEEIKTFDMRFIERLLADCRNSIFFDAKPFLKRYRFYEPVGFDALLAAYVLLPGRGSYLLESLAQSYLEIRIPVTPEEKVTALYRLRRVLSDKLHDEETYDVYQNIELPLTPVLAEMENVGVKVDVEMLEEYSKSLTTTLENTQKRIFEIAGTEFNIASPQQLRKVLFEEMKIPTGKKTKTGFSTSADVLIQLAAEHEIVREILAWRELSKLKNTYVDVLPRLIADDGRIHTTYSQTVAATGRLSSNEPNLQNIPIRTELGREIRRAFVADKGKVLASLDYSQIELRILAHMSKDPILVEAFRNRIDVHTLAASKIWNEPIEKVSSQHRRYAKTLNYAILYGVTDFGLASQFGGAFSVAETKEMIEQYFRRFPRVKAFIEDVLRQARTKGYTTTLTGRKRYFPDIHAGNRVARAYAERQAINAPMQGTSADMIKIAMIRASELLRDKNTKMILQVHDELVFECDPSELSLIKRIKEIMENALPLDVPVEVDVEIGPNWLEMEKMEDC